MLVLLRGGLRGSHCSMLSSMSGTKKGRRMGRGRHRSRTAQPPGQQLQLAEVQWRLGQPRARRAPSSAVVVVLLEEWEAQPLCLATLLAAASDTS